MQMLWRGVQLQMQERTQSSGKRTPVPSRPETTKEDGNRRIDQKETSKLKRIAERQEANLKRMNKLKTDESKSQADSDVSAEDDTYSSNNEYVPVSVKTKPKPDRQS